MALRGRATTSQGDLPRPTDSGSRTGLITALVVLVVLIGGAAGWWFVLRDGGGSGGATAAQIEELGETVRARVKASSGIELDWEIKRIGIAPGAAA